MPPVEQLVGVPRQPLTDLSGLTAPVDHRLEIAARMRPAELPHLDPAVAGEPIADDDAPGDLTEDLAGHAAAAACRDGEDRHRGRQRNPQPRLGPVLAPRGLIDVDHLGLADMVMQLGHGTPQHRGGLPPELGDHARRQ